ncbi:MAG TPA: hypothetical protein VNZ03_06635 [Terriglobales bacterium]|nr:hypothetical protein [Terriglobales bacterium]
MKRYSAERPRNQDRMNQDRDWQSLYNDAVAEPDPITLLQKIEAAQRAIIDRLDDDALHGRNPINHDEEQAIEDGVSPGIPAETRNLRNSRCKTLGLGSALTTESRTGPYGCPYQ